MRLTLKSIIRWEQLSSKPFTDIDITSESDIETLLYCTSEMSVPFNTYKGTFDSPKVLKKKISELVSYMEVYSQFIPKEESKGEGCYIKDVASTLIASGIGPHFVFEELELQDLPIITKAIEERKKEDMESKRLFTYLTILPHIDASKLPNGAKDLLPFPWDEEIKKETPTPPTEEEYNNYVEQLKKAYHGTT